MSKENLEQFMRQVTESEDLQSRMGDEIAGDDLVALGAEHGWEFTFEDLLAAAELSDEELERVAGGAVTVRGTDLHMGNSDGKGVRLEIWGGNVTLARRTGISGSGQADDVPFKR